jgi:hypothetical protein
MKFTNTSDISDGLRDVMNEIRVIEKVLKKHWKRIPQSEDLADLATILEEKKK